MKKCDAEDKEIKRVNQLGSLNQIIARLTIVYTKKIKYIVALL